MEDASRFIAQGLAVLTNPLPNNQNMKLRTIDPHCALGGDQNPSEANTGQGCINMVHDAKVLTRTKDYGSSQLDLGKEPAPPKSPLCIEKPTDKPEVAPRIPKGVLKCSRNNPNSRVAQNYSIVKDLNQTPCAMSTLEVLRVQTSHKECGPNPRQQNSSGWLGH